MRVGFVLILMLMGCFAGNDGVRGERVALRSEVGFEVGLAAFDFSEAVEALVGVDADDGVLAEDGAF